MTRPRVCPQSLSPWQRSRRTRSGSGSRPTTTRRSRRLRARSWRPPSAPARPSPGPVPLPTEKNVYCVIRSPFKDKDSREHFEIRTHKRLIDIHQPTPKTVDSLQRLDHLPAGVDIQIQLVVGDGRAPRKEARDDPGLRSRGRSRRARDRARGGALPRDRHPHARPRRLRGRAARLRRGAREAADEGRARPPQEGRRAGAAPPARVPRRGRRAPGGRDRDRRGVREGPDGQGLRHLEGQGLPGHDQAPQLLARARVARLAQRPRARARSAPPPTPRACSRASAARARWATSASPSAASRSWTSARARTCCSCAARCRAPKGTVVEIRTDADGRSQGALHRQEAGRSRRSTRPCSARSSTSTSCTRPRAPS